MTQAPSTMEYLGELLGSILVVLAFVGLLALQHEPHYPDSIIGEYECTFVPLPQGTGE